VGGVLFVAACIDLVDALVIATSAASMLATSWGTSAARRIRSVSALVITAPNIEGLVV
jgi:hypothetical protein